MCVVSAATMASQNDSSDDESGSYYSCDSCLNDDDDDADNLVQPSANSSSHCAVLPAHHTNKLRQLLDSLEAGRRRRSPEIRKLREQSEEMGKRRITTGNQRLIQCQPSFLHTQRPIQQSHVNSQIPVRQEEGWTAQKEKNHLKDQLKNATLYKWQLNGGQGWMDIANDDVIEAQYSKPYSNGIKLHSTPWGTICIDFERKQVCYRQDVQVRRLSSLHTTWLWYVRGEAAWNLYEIPDSSLLETEYQKNRWGRYLFIYHSYEYKISFKDMFEENFSTGEWRPVRRRPAFPDTGRPIQKKKNSPPDTQRPVQTKLTYSMSMMTIAGASIPPIWQFRRSGGMWQDFIPKVGTNSTQIEAAYHKNSNGTMTFTKSGQHYLLDFYTMTQTNISTGETCHIQRV